MSKDARGHVTGSPIMPTLTSQGHEMVTPRRATPPSGPDLTSATPTSWSSRIQRRCPRSPRARSPSPPPAASRHSAPRRRRPPSGRHGRPPPSTAPSPPSARPRRTPRRVCSCRHLTAARAAAGKMTSLRTAPTPAARTERGSVHWPSSRGSRAR